MRKRILSVLLAITTTISVMGTSVTTYASTNNSYNISMDVQSNIEDYEGGFESQKGIKTKVIKEIIEFIISHGDDVAKVIEKVSGKNVAKKFLRHHAKVAIALQPLLNYAELSKQVVYDAIYRTLINMNVASKIAANIALAVREALDWIVF